MSKELTPDNLRDYIQKYKAKPYKDLTEVEKRWFAGYYCVDYEEERQKERLEKLKSILDSLFNETMPHGKISIKGREEFRERALKVLKSYIKL